MILELLGVVYHLHAMALEGIKDGSLKGHKKGGVKD
ncbi:hypothetical protein Desmer_4052 [Desulfosporosinus meridiei DSM 13257]|uniref:Uncharacterized protein n=1 Tax=Desulfosporosinus meridiei (strain ATCC BAA-275 / DSM 13257 / KCTC 12902 / NCIMB 13706 / S10) TaxID=768704 RepID=J7J3N9_DESMD|nr:hypothetical protein Desmer_4052 [Desulfosporosinus meridiei DSM 13257]